MRLVSLQKYTATARNFITTKVIIILGIYIGFNTTFVIKDLMQLGSHSSGPVLL